MPAFPHQFIDRSSGSVVTEKLKSDRLVNLIYSQFREHTPTLFKAVTSARVTDFLGYVNYDVPLNLKFTSTTRYLEMLNINTEELLDDPATLNTARKVFERRIKFDQFRPMPENPYTVISPADAKTLIGSLNAHSLFHIKDKFFSYDELIGLDSVWRDIFRHGEFAIFRLTPDKYHFNHVPVSGLVADYYEIDGCFHSCNPTAVVEVLTPNSKNRRMVTIIDTDVPGGSQVGRVAMIEVVAMMIGAVEQCYSEHGYDHPQPISPGQFIKRGCVKSLFHPGSSTDILLFEPDRIAFADDLQQNVHHPTAQSRYTNACGKPTIETDLQVRSLVAHRIHSPQA